MRELAKSAANYTWAMSLFGVQQAANLLALSNCRQPGAKQTPPSLPLTNPPRCNLTI